MKYLFLENLNPAEVIARAAYRRMNAASVEAFRDLGGVSALPSGFDVSSKEWLKAESAIDAAARAGDVEKTTALCAEYERRAKAYFEAWRKKTLKQKGVAA